MRSEGANISRAASANVASIRGIGSEQEQSDMLSNLDDQIAAVRDRFAELDEEYQDQPKALAAATEQLERHIALLERQKQTVANISPEYMAQVSAVRAQEAALAAAKQRAEELGKEVARAVEAYDKSAEQRALDQMAPDDAERLLLGRAGAQDLSALRAYIEQQKESNDLKDYEQERLLEMISLEQQLVAVQQRQTEEREKAAQQATRLADMQADMVLEAEKAVAQAMGDKAAVRAIEIEEKTRQMAKSLEAQGMDPNEAMLAARQQAELMQLAGEINQTPTQQMAQGDAQRSIGLGGSAGLGPSADAQREMVRRQQEANRLLSDIRNNLARRTPVMLAEVFD